MDILPEEPLGNQPQEPPLPPPSTPPPPVSLPPELPGTAGPPSETPGPTQRAPSAQRKWLLIAGAWAIAAAAALVFYQFVYANPGKILEKSFTKLSKVDSLVASYESPDRQVGVNFNYHEGKNLFSQLDFNLSDEIEGEKFDLKGSLVVNEKDLYLLSSMSKIQELLDQVEGFFPPLVQTQTFQLLRPVLLGQKWLHFSLPKEWTERLASTEKQKEEISPQDMAELEKIASEARVIRKYQRSYAQNGQQYQRIILGFKQEKLVQLLEKVKDLNLDVKVSDLNDLIKIVQGVPNWNDDLVEVLIDKSGYPAVVSMSLPDIPEDALRASLEKSLEKGSGISALLGSPTDLIDGLLKSKDRQKTGKLQPLGTVKFSDYNNAPQVNVPTNTVEFETVLEKAKIEILPILTSFLGSAMTEFGQGLTPPGTQPDLFNLGQD